MQHRDSSNNVPYIPQVLSTSVQPTKTEILGRRAKCHRIFDQLEPDTGSEHKLMQISLQHMICEN